MFVVHNSCPCHKSIRITLGARPLCALAGYLGRECINRKSKPPALPDGRGSFDSSRSLASDTVAQ